MAAEKIAALFLLAALVGGAQTEYKGKLERTLALPERARQLSSFVAAPAEVRVRLGGRVGAEDRVFAGTIREHNAYLVERPEAAALLVDVDGDGRIGPGEEWPLRPATEPEMAGVTEIAFPLPGPVYRAYPVRVSVYRAKDADSRIVADSPRAFVRGTVVIHGKPVRVEYGFDREQGAAHADYGWQGMDGNGDGRIEEGAQSTEFAFADDEIVVFRVGDEYVSTRRLDMERGEVTLQSHGQEAYRRIELRDGLPFPDVEMEDFAGRRFRLSDFRGRYVLLDFWASWCGPCLADLPQVRAARAQFQTKGFEVIGMNVDKEEAQGRTAAVEHQLIWPQARYESIRMLVKAQLRLMAYPTYILLGPDRQVVAHGSAVSGRTLAELLGRYLNKE